jgi:hypothetical protein
MRRLTHLLVLTAFVFSCGGQWYVLQGVAWANMIREYSQTVPLAQAVQMTFSGEHPCAICKAIAAKRSSERQNALSLEKYEKKFISSAAVAVEPPASSSFQYPDDVTVLRSRIETPPTPPPRSLLS